VKQPFSQIENNHCYLLRPFCVCLMQQ